MKKCSSCANLKELHEFHKNKCTHDGLQNVCKVCKNLMKSEWTQKQKLNRPTKIKISEHPDYQKNWYRKNIDRVKGYNKKHILKKRAYLAKYRALKRSGTLKGYETEIMKIYENCPEGHEVDHIMPLKHKDFCGLHVPWNLQYLTKFENRSKGNKFYE